MAAAATSLSDSELWALVVDRCGFAGAQSGAALALTPKHVDAVRELAPAIAPTPISAEKAATLPP